MYSETDFKHFIAKNGADLVPYVSVRSLKYFKSSQGFDLHTISWEILLWRYVVTLFLAPD